MLDLPYFLWNVNLDATSMTYNDACATSSALVAYASLVPRPHPLFNVARRLRGSLKKWEWLMPRGISLDSSLLSQYSWITTQMSRIYHFNNYTLVSLHLDHYTVPATFCNTFLNPAYFHRTVRSLLRCAGYLTSITHLVGIIMLLSPPPPP